MNKYQESLDNLCKNCQSLMNEIDVPIRKNEISNGNCGHRLCPYRHIDNDYCEDYKTLQELIDNYSKIARFDRAVFFNADGLCVDGVTYEQLEKALDKACVILNRYEEKEYRQMGFDEIEIDNSTKTPNEWKEYLLQESEKQ